MTSATRWAAVLCAFLWTHSTQAQTPLLDEVHTIATATSAVPIEHTFDVSVAGTYTITLTDEGAQLTPAAPLTSVQLAVTSGTKVVALLKAAGSVALQASIGTYAIHVVGTPGKVPGSGLIGIQVNDASNAQLAGFSDLLAVASTVQTSEGVLNDTFTVPSTGSYQVSLSDLLFPQALSILTLAIVQEGGGLITALPGGTNPVTLNAGVTYRIFAAGQLATGVSGGLYGVNVSPAGGPPVYAKTISLGTVTLIDSPTLTAGGYTLSVTDSGLPNPLAQLGAAVTFNGQSVAQLTAAGSQPFTGTAATYSVYGFGVSSTGPGSYLVTVGSGTTNVVSAARAVGTTGGSDFAYSFDTTLPAAGTYSFDLADFQYPAAFTTLTAVAIQNGKQLVTAAPLAIGSSVANSPTTGTQSVTAVAGPVTVLVYATGAATGSVPGAGLFGVDLTASGAAEAAFETTQGVGQPFVSRKLSITSAGDYDVQAIDVGFPASFQNLAVFVTRGTSRVGSIFGGGVFPFTAVTGNYYVNFVAQPTATDAAGTYSLAVAPAPTITTFQSSASSVSAGATVTLNWATQNTSACTASGGWTGSQLTSGTATSAAISAATAFTLTCTGGAGSSATATVNVSLTVPPPPPPKSGGGAIDASLVALLFVLAILRAHRQGLLRVVTRTSRDASIV
jgi:hypothetical protein